MNHYVIDGKKFIVYEGSLYSECLTFNEKPDEVVVKNKRPVTKTKLGRGHRMDEGLKKDIISELRAGQKVSQIVKDYGVSNQAVYKLKSGIKKSGTDDQEIGHGPKKFRCTRGHNFNKRLDPGYDDEVGLECPVENCGSDAYLL